MNIAPPRQEYIANPLEESDVDPSPFQQFGRWFGEAIGAGLPQPNAMTLATCGAGGAPSARMVLLKDFDARGFVFYTNYGSRKARELEENPRAALVFYWYELHRQVRIAGTVERVSRKESEAYFRTRPAMARLGAAASLQSRELERREILDARVRELSLQYPDGDVPLPEEWGGYRLLPTEMEFWQGRENRLHDRLQYRLESNGWRLLRLYP